MNVDWSPLIGKSIMITGSTGFLGSHLAKSVQQADFVVLPFHKQVQNYPDSLPQVDYIIHAAGYASPSIFTKQPIDTIQINTEIPIKLIQHLNPDGSFLFC